MTRTEKEKMLAGELYDAGEVLLQRDLACSIKKRPGDIDTNDLRPKARGRALPHLRKIL